MTSIEVAAAIFGCLLVGALAGMGLRGIIPQHHLDPDTRDLIKLGVGLIGTMSALVLGLLVASTKGSYDTKRSELAQMAGNAILLDRVLAWDRAPERKLTQRFGRGDANAASSDRQPSAALCAARRLSRREAGNGG